MDLNTERHFRMRLKGYAISFSIQKRVIYTDYYARPAVDFFGRLHSIENIKNGYRSGKGVCS